MMHRFTGAWIQQTAMMQMPNFLKNIALAASALMFLASSAAWLSLGHELMNTPPYPKSRTGSAVRKNDGFSQAFKQIVS